MPNRQDPVLPASASTSTDVQHWDLAGGLDLAAAWLLPGGRVLEFRLRWGPSYQVELGTLGFAAPGLLATPDHEGRVVVLATGAGELVDVTTSRPLAACDPACSPGRG